jgi:hypothetical protein
VCWSEELRGCVVEPVGYLLVRPFAEHMFVSKGSENSCYRLVSACAGQGTIQIFGSRRIARSGFLE